MLCMGLIESTLNDMGNMGGPKPTSFCWLYINLYQYHQSVFYFLFSYFALYFFSNNMGFAIEKRKPMFWSGFMFIGIQIKSRIK